MPVAKPIAKKKATITKPAIAAPAKSARTVRSPSPVAAKKAPAPKAVPVKRAVKAKVKLEKPVKVKKPKLVRDSFTIPKDEYAVLETLKQRAGLLNNPTKKSELLRAGIKALAAMPDAAFLAALKVVPSIKTGRPAKD